MQPVLYVRRPGSDDEQTYRFPDDDPFFSEISNFIDVIEDIEEDPDAAQILSSYEGAFFQYSDTKTEANECLDRCGEVLRAHLGHSGG